MKITQEHMFVSTFSVFSNFSDCRILSRVTFNFTDHWQNPLSLILNSSTIFSWYSLLATAPILHSFRTIANSCMVISSRALYFVEDLLRAVDLLNLLIHIELWFQLIHWLNLSNAHLGQDTNARFTPSNLKRTFLDRDA